MGQKVTSTANSSTMLSIARHPQLVLVTILLCFSLIPLKTLAKQPNYYAEGLQEEFSGNPDTALERYKLSAQAGVSDAKFALGRLYRDTYGDEIKSFKWFLAAAKQGNAFAQYEIGIIYRDGTSNTQQDTALATKWLTASANKKYAAAAYALFEISYNDEHAAKWLKKAADLGNPEAMRKLAYSYNYGEYGLGTDLILSQQWADQAKQMQEEGAK